MKHRPPLARRGAAVLAGALALTLGASLTASPDARGADAAAASAASTWLAGELDDDGHYPNPLSGGVDYGLMVDALYAMYASGDGDLAEPIIEALDDNEEAEKYFTYFGIGAGWAFNDGLDDRIGGATAKTLLAAQIAGRDVHDFGGYDLVEEALTTVVKAEDFASGGRFEDGGFRVDSDFDGVITDADSIVPVNEAEVGRVIDLGPTTFSNNANSFGQILGVIALARAGELTRPMVDALLWQRCPEGYFRIFYSFNADTNLPENCADAQETPVWNQPGQTQNMSPPDGDATGFGLSALLAAKAAGITGLDDEIQDTVDWLVDNQDEGGGWGGGVGTEEPNTNSTGLVVQALAAAGAPADVVADGEAFLASAQATDADSANALASDIGAIAYQPDDYQAAKTNGITNLDTWIRATAQAQLGIAQVGFWELSAGPLPAVVLRAQAPRKPLLVRNAAVIKVRGLTAGEAVTASVGEATVGTGTAGGNGVASVPVTLPGSTQQGAVVIRFTGAAEDRTGTLRAQAVKRARLIVTPARSRVSVGDVQRITVAGLVRGERVTVRIRGQRRSAVATARGVATVKVKAARPLGGVIVDAFGAYDVRAGKASFRVVR